jgi:hypothetical protein
MSLQAVEEDYTFEFSTKILNAAINTSPRTILRWTPRIGYRLNLFHWQDFDSICEALLEVTQSSIWETASRCVMWAREAARSLTGQPCVSGCSLGRSTGRLARCYHGEERVSTGSDTQLMTTKKKCEQAQSARV